MLYALKWGTINSPIVTPLCAPLKGRISIWPAVLNYLRSTYRNPFLPYFPENSPKTPVLYPALKLAYHTSQKSTPELFFRKKTQVSSLFQKVLKILR